MDSITQATLGAAIGEALLGDKDSGYKGALAGAVVATIPDLDVLLHLFYSSYDMLSIHRGYSHSIVVSFIGAIIIAAFLKKGKWFSLHSFSKLYLFAWLALFTHILLDAFTAYGTQLFLPFSTERFGFDSINVVDPVYTVPMLIGLFLSLYYFKASKNRAIFNKIGLGISSFYLCCTLINKSLVNQHFEQQLAAENIEYNTLLTMPVGMANYQWYAVARNDKNLYLKKFSYFSNESFPTYKFEINDKILDELPPPVKEKMKWFAKGFYTVMKVDNAVRIYNLQVDMRGVKETSYGLVPTLGYFEITPLKNENFIFSSGTHNK